MGARMDVREFECESCIRGYHVYKEIWNPTVGEHLICERESLNPSDRYAVAVVKDDVIIGHLPRVLSQLCSLFIARGGTISCIVNGARRYSEDLAQGGLEVPCKLNFLSTSKEIKKLKLLLARNSI